MTQTAKPVDESQALVKVLNDAMPDLKRMAPRHVNLTRLMALALEAKMRNPLLAKTSVTSVLAFCKKLAEWGTDRVGAGGVWPVPFWNDKTKTYDMQAIPDWRFLVEKAKKAKAILHATADVVRERDEFAYARGMSPDLTHRPALGATGEVIAAYCIYTLPDGTKDFVVMARTELDGIRNRSKAWQGYLRDKSKTCPYNTDPEEMMKKTVIKRALKLFEGASVELATVLDADHKAMGFDFTMEAQEPIAMPRAIEAAPEEAPASTEHQQSPPPANNAPAGDETITVEGVIQDVVVKKGETKGKPWTRYGIVINGQTYGTFDTVIGEGAREYEGRSVILRCEQDGKYLTCIDMEIIGGEETDQP